MLAAKDPGKLDEITGLAAGARANIGAVEFDVAHVFRLLALSGVGMTGDRWLKLENQWLKGKIGAKECIHGQMECIPMTKKKLQEYLKPIQLDPAFKKILSLLRAKKIPFHRVIIAGAG